MEDIVPGQRATVEVALAVIGGIPRARRAGKVTRVPPPAMAFMAAPTAAASAVRGRRVVCSMRPAEG
jgi:hypothetical protein